MLAIDFDDEVNLSVFFNNILRWFPNVENFTLIIEESFLLEFEHFLNMNGFNDWVQLIYSEEFDYKSLLW